MTTHPALCQSTSALIRHHLIFNRAIQGALITLKLRQDAGFEMLGPGGALKIEVDDFSVTLAACATGINHRIVNHAVRIARGT